MAAPVLVPVSTSREPPVVVITLALTPAFGAELMAAAMPERVLLVESMAMSVEEPPTEIVRVPVPTAAVADRGAEVAVATVASYFRARRAARVDPAIAIRAS